MGATEGRGSGGRDAGSAEETAAPMALSPRLRLGRRHAVPTTLADSSRGHDGSVMQDPSKEHVSVSQHIFTQISSCEFCSIVGRSS